MKNLEVSSTVAKLPVYRKSQRGVSLIGVVISASIGTVVLLAMSVGLMDMLKQKEGVVFSKEAELLTDQIRSTLGDSVACTNTLGGLNMAPGVTHAVNEIKDGSPPPGATKYDLATIYGERKVQIAAMRLQDYNIVAGQIGDAVLYIQYNNLGVGPLNTIYRTIDIRVETDAAGILIKCISVSKMAEGLWRRSPANLGNIYYEANAAGGKVGIGVDDPQYELHLRSQDEGFAVEGDQATTVLSDDGGIELYRSNASGTLPAMKGYLDFKNSMTDDFDARIEYTQAAPGVEPGIVFRHTLSGETGAPGSATNASLYSTNEALMVSNAEGQAKVIAAGVGDTPYTYSGFYLAKLNAPTPTPYSDYYNSVMLADSWVMAFKRNEPGIPPDSYAISRWVGGAMNYHLVINPSGNVGLGVTTASEKLDVGGNLRVSGTIVSGSDMRAQNFIASSDQRLKKDIEPISPVESWEGLEQLKPVTYKWKQDDDEKLQSGLIAQDLEKVFPHLVHDSKDGMKGIDYVGLTAYLLTALKEQREEHMKLLKKVERLEEKIR